MFAWEGDSFSGSTLFSLNADMGLQLSRMKKDDPEFEPKIPEPIWCQA